MDLASQQDWADRLGLLPIPLRTGPDPQGRFVLLNGASGNFCLDVTGDASPDEQPKSLAWSANCGHHVLVGENDVVVQRWDQPTGAIERYRRDSVNERLEDFHSYLERSRPADELSVVAHAIRVFRQLRSAAGHRVTGQDALRAFMLLLACADEKASPESIDLEKWHIDPDAPSVLGEIEFGWKMFVDELEMSPTPLAGLRLDLELLLRHASGELFQEAHYEALLDPQLQLAFATPRPAVLSKSTVGTGLHFTPTPLARCLVEQCLEAASPDCNSPVTVFDPACGSGEFLREALRQLLNRGHSGPISLIGWDISEAAITMAKFALAWDVRKSGMQVGLELECRDSLANGTEWPTTADMLLMNPPFVSWEAMSPARRDLVRSVLGPSFKHRPDLASVFILNAAECLHERAVLGSILPASFLNSDSMQGLRARLGETLAPILLARLGSHLLFPSALIDTALYVGKCGVSGAGPPLAVWVDHRSSSTFEALRALRKRLRRPNALAEPHRGDGWDLYVNPELGRDRGSWAPRSFKAWSVLTASRLPKVSDLFHVRQGVRTGNNRAFLLKEAEWSALPKLEQEYFRPAVVNAAVANGRLIKNTYVFYPYGDRHIESESRLQKAVPTYYSSHLRPHKQALQQRARMDPARWWDLMWPRAWHRETEARLVSTFFGDRGSFAWDAAGEFIVVQGYVWLAKRKRGMPRKSALAYLALLNSAFFEMLLAGVSNHVSGGQWDLATRFVSELRVPDFVSNTGMGGTLETLAELGDVIQKGGLSALSQSQELLLEDNVESAYHS